MEIHLNKQGEQKVLFPAGHLNRAARRRIMKRNGAFKKRG